MRLISAVQSQNARRLMSWDQDDLAMMADVGIQTVRNFEKGETIRPETIEKIHYAFENSGIVFTEDDGVKRRNKWCEVYSGPDSCDRLFQEMAETSKLQGSAVWAFIAQPEILMDMSGLPRRNNLERMECIQDYAKIRCVLSEAAVPADFAPIFDYKVVAPSLTSLPRSVFSFGKKYADIQKTPDGHFLIIVIDVSITALGYQASIDRLWNYALSLEATRQPKYQNIRS